MTKKYKAVQKSDNLGGYKVKSISDYIGDNAIPKPPTKSEKHVEEHAVLMPLPPKKSKISPSEFGLILLIVIIAIFSFAYISHVNSNSKSKVLGSSSTSGPQNPLTNNGSIDAQLKYCSNPVNAENNC